jgi:DNA (cytosine-5)-methyltransferase 1
MKILNLYCGIGGNRKLWGNVHQITAVENNQEVANIYKEFFPNDIVIIEDAHQYLLKHYKEFDIIWGSPPCPTHSKIRRCGVYCGQNSAEYPDMKLYQEIIFLKYFANPKTKWIIENVKPYYDYLIKPQREIGRHVFWSNFQIQTPLIPNNAKPIELQSTVEGRYGFDISKFKIKHRKDQILRNLVDPKIGEFILKQALLQNKSFNFTK